VPIAFRIEDGIAFTDMGATFTVAEIRAYLAAVPAHAAFRPGMPSLVDCRQVTSLLSPEELRAVAADVAGVVAVPVRGKCAVLASTDVVFGLMRMYEAYTEDAPVVVRVFRDHDLAMTWLAEPFSEP
jgi:hypothetical protein